MKIFNDSNIGLHVGNIYDSLVGQYVIVHTKGPGPLEGTLVAYNGSILLLTNKEKYGLNNVYILSSNVVAICADK